MYLWCYCIVRIVIRSLGFLPMGLSATPHVDVFCIGILKYTSTTRFRVNHIVLWLHFYHVLWIVVIWLQYFIFTSQKQKPSASIQVTCTSEDDHLKCSDQREIPDVYYLKNEQLFPVENKESVVASVHIDCSRVADAVMGIGVQQAVIYWYETAGSVKHRLVDSFPWDIYMVYTEPIGICSCLLP